ncbi:hypothetical protein [Lichenifustis flavocetrariae]|uniref:Uncharacterized protein n=1 Tax=Lichenifustis flavocetrariae TaxID=2949735 RepID=A0AA41YT73_9HYPH|nr:hypothetical protein [Lichenifustis flavocetrariae]MCW6506577.1 hypothetical protein [Lichenifustis flavocetrariae]
MAENDAVHPVPPEDLPAAEHEAALKLAEARRLAKEKLDGAGLTPDRSLPKVHPDDGT